MEDRYTETHKTWNKIANLYEEMFMELELYNDTYKRFCELLPKSNASVLEIGCGPGNITRHILNINPRLKILATDISENMINLTKKNNPEVDVQILDCRNLNLINKTFNSIVCGFTIPYLSQSDCSKLISDCSKLLSKEGIIYISFVSGEYKKSGFISSSSGDRTYFYYHDIQKIKDELELNQLTIVDVIQKEHKKSDTVSEVHTIITAKNNQII